MHAVAVAARRATESSSVARLRTVIARVESTHASREHAAKGQRTSAQTTGPKAAADVTGKTAKVSCHAYADTFDKHKA